ncbi:MAG: hypothetical protein ACLFQV_12625 [Vulcanimicrobiota bacterium]
MNKKYFGVLMVFMLFSLCMMAMTVEAGVLDVKEPTVTPTPTSEPTPTPTPQVSKKVYLTGSRWASLKNVWTYMNNRTLGPQLQKLVNQRYENKVNKLIAQLEKKITRWKKWGKDTSQLENQIANYRRELADFQKTRKDINDFLNKTKEWDKNADVFNTKHVKNHTYIVDENGNILGTLTTQQILNGNNSRDRGTFVDEGTDINTSYVDQETGVDFSLSGFEYINGIMFSQAHCPLFSGGSLVYDGVEYEVVAFASVTPIIIDLDRNDMPDVDRNEWLPHPQRFNISVAKKFDMDGDGDKNLVEWIGPNDGFLVIPSEELEVEDGVHLFGSCYGFVDGYQKLGVLRDANLDGVVKGEELDRLMVWVDKNQNALCEKEELTSVQGMGITSINVDHEMYKSSCIMNGKEVTTWDWWPTAMIVRPGVKK